MPLEIDWLLRQLVTFSFGAIVSGIVVYLLATRFLSTYLNKKGENLATKEDVQHITDLVKEVEHRYNVLLEEKKATQQLRMAALDKRLEAHQKAFALWRKLTMTEGFEVGPAVIECQTWWEENCLYLEPEVREAFPRAYVSYNTRQQLLECRGSADSIKAAWADVIRFPDVLFNALARKSLLQWQS